MKRYFLLVTIFSVLFSCQQSIPKRYYLLSAPASEQSEQSISKLIGLGPIELAEYLNRPNMIRMRSDNTLNLSGSDYWAEPLENGIVRTLGLNLTKHDASRMVQAFPWRSDSVPAYSLRIRISELIQKDNKASINATWELIETSSKKMLERKHFVRSIDSGSGAESMAEAYSALLAQLADEMHEALVKVGQ